MTASPETPVPLAGDRAGSTVRTPHRSQVLGRILALVGVAVALVTQVRDLTFVPLLVGLVALGLPGIGPSGSLRPVRLGPTRWPVVAGGVLATWWLFTPTATFFTYAAWGMAACHCGIAFNRRVTEADARRWHLLCLWQYGPLIAIGGFALATQDPPATAVLVWVVLMAAYPMALHGAQVEAASPDGGWRRSSRVGRALAAVVVVALLLPIVLALLSGVRLPGAGEPGYGDPSAAGEVPRSYWGLDGYIDTSTRGDLPDTEVLRVQAERPDYWRAGTYDVWDGRYWTPSVDGGASLVPAEAAVDGSQYLPAAVAGGPGQRSLELTQTFRVVAGIHNALYGASTPVEVETPGLGVTVRADGTLFSSHQLGPGSQWTVRSARPAVTPSGLRAMGVIDATSGDAATSPGPQPSAEAVQVPSFVSYRVRELAAEITVDAETTYDEVIAIETWLADNIEYSTSSPVPEEGEDAVARTLFVDREGDCDQIAGAFVILARSVGIPARVAVGFTPERFDSFRGEYVSLASNAHAWAEVWFGDAGWVGFDPTTDVPLAGEPSGTTSLWERLLPCVAALAGVVLVALLGWWMASRWQRHREAARDPHRRLRRLLLGFERVLAERTRPRRRGETLAGFARAVSPPSLVAPAVDLAERLTDVAFGTSGTDLAGLEADLDELSATWPRPPLRRRLWKRGWQATAPG